ncbi:leucine-rich repeat protein [Roseburia sp. BX1005]|uniref:Leucine-rich repeat protein n=1 Tax=Roseburia zhanii TaxID=2763064 RepID=A0A923RT52_9FIRM|nr:leucine-rich repeat protein [Roseburia zhanii]
MVKGTKLTDKKGNTYKVTNVKKKEVTFVAQKKNAKGTLTIPATITAGKQKYKVTAIAAKACKGNRKITKVTIGKNVKSIGKQAFYGCKKLKKITIKSTSLKNKNIGKQAFSKIAKNAKIIMTSI